jgi:hypothetical protein
LPRHADRTRAITAAERRLRLLNDALKALEERDYDTMLARVARLVVSSFAEICVMFRLNPGGSVEEMHLAHVRGEREPDLQALEDALRDVATPIPSDYLPTILEGRSLLLSELGTRLTSADRGDSVLDVSERLAVALRGHLASLGGGEITHLGRHYHKETLGEFPQYVLGIDDPTFLQNIVHRMAPATLDALWAVVQIIIAEVPLLFIPCIG